MKLWLTAKWFIGTWYRFFTLQVWATETCYRTRGRKGNYFREAHCRVCNEVFYRTTKFPVCQKRKCYIAWHENIEGKLKAREAKVVK